MMGDNARRLEPAERRDHGRRLRKACSRVEQARCKPPSDRQDPLALITAANRGRVPQIVPIKYQRMAASAFGFFRGWRALWRYVHQLAPRAGAFRPKASKRRK
jgi:hypothetical protein